MPLRFLAHANIPHLCKSLHYLCPVLSPYVPPKFPSTSVGAPQIRSVRRRGGGTVKATLDVPRRRVTRKSPILIPLQQEEDEEEQPSIESLESLFIPPGVDASELQRAKRLQGSNIVLSPYAKDGQIKKAEYIKSSTSVEDCPTDGYPEFALVGRSNVGKSSLVNSLVKRKQLAMTSKKPGKTQLINHFLINDSWYLVDLPGYGYAIAPQAIRTDWNEFTKEYFLNRKALVCVLLLIDASIPAKQIDIDCATWLGQNKIPMTFVFTKCDKRKKKKGGNKRPEENIYDFQNLIKEFFEETPPWIMTSSVTNQGRDEMLLHISQLRNYWLEH